MASNTLPQPVPKFFLRGTQGVSLFNGPPEFSKSSEFEGDSSKTCRVTVWSPDGKYLAWANGSKVRAAVSPDFKVIAEFARPKVAQLQFSPKGTFLCTWEPYIVTKDIPANTPNLHIFHIESQQVVKSYVQKRQTSWEPLWSSDEKLLARNINQELQVYETDKMDHIAHKIADVKVAEFSIAPGPAPYHFVCYIPGSKGQPSFAKLYRYPQLNQSGVIANKSFFQADRVEMKWNKTGTSCLLLTSLDVDSTGASYYGKQSLHYLDTKGETAMVQLPKDGPIYSVEWSPRSNEFCVVYGFMPAKATLFNLKCEVKFDFGTGPRNTAFYNSQGSLLLLGGFGNLRGKIDIWDVKTCKSVSTMEAPDSTFLQWCPSGQTFLTATTAPRLRVGNGVKVWHYSGSLLFEHKVDSPEELWETSWQPFPDGVFKDFVISTKKVEGIQPSQPQASKEIYRPPGARGTSGLLKHLEEREAPSKPNAPAADKAELSKNALKNKKKREARKAKREEENPEDDEEKVKPVVKSGIQVQLTGDLEKDKQIRNLKKKLDQIAKLKADLATGKNLELNQREKIGKEEEYLQELEKLTI